MKHNKFYLGTVNYVNTKKIMLSWYFSKLINILQKILRGCLRMEYYLNFNFFCLKNQSINEIYMFY